MAKAAAKTKPPRSLLKIFDMEQGSPEWHAIRAGVPTASNFSIIMANGRDGGPSVTRTKLLHKLAGELITGEPAEESFRSAAMDRGIALEDEARQSYCRRKGVELQRIGFARNFDGLKLCGASPDALLGFDSGLEVKTAKAEVLIPLLQRPASMPNEHRCQIQGNMLVLERESWNLTIYCHRSMPAMDVKVYRDDAFIRELHEQIERFNFELKRLVESLQKMGPAG